MKARLIVTESDRERVHEILEPRVVIGTDPDCGLIVRDQKAAPTHCEVREVDGGYKVVDLESAEGTAVNGRVVNQHMLRNGDTILVGSVRISYLGPSARHGTPAPLPVPMKALPVAEDGEPRRFYRHEVRRKSSAPQVTLALMGGLAALGLALWALKSTSYGDQQEKDFQQARQLLQRGDAESLRAGIEILKGIPVERKYGEFHVREVLRDAENDLKRIRDRESADAADRFYAETMNHFRAHPEERDWMPNRLRTFREKWPQDPRIGEMERLAEASRLGSPEKEAAWRAAENAIRQALNGSRYKSAFEELAKVEADPDLSSVFRPKLTQYRTTIERAFALHFDRQCAAALDAKARGDVALAARIYSELADVGVEPQSSEAKRFLDKLR